MVDCCASLPNAISVTLVAWNWPRWEYLCHRNQQTLQITAPPNQEQFLDSYQESTANSPCQSSLSEHPLQSGAALQPFLTIRHCPMVRSLTSLAGIKVEMEQAASRIECSVWKPPFQWGWGTETWLICLRLISLQVGFPGKGLISWKTLWKNSNRTLKAITSIHPKCLDLRCLIMPGGRLVPPATRNTKLAGIGWNFFPHQVT